MNGLAIIGILLIIYGIAVVFIAAKKPPTVWNMAKIRAFKKVLGEKGTVIFFYLFAVACWVVGVWLMLS